MKFLTIFERRQHEPRPTVHYFYIMITTDLCRSDDEYDEAIGTLLSIGASVLKVVGEKILEYYNSSQEMFDNIFHII